jgi:hypothetical protein
MTHDRARAWSATAVLAVAVTIGWRGPAARAASCATATAGGAWQNAAFAPQSATFTAEFDATPSAAPTNSVVGLSQGAQTDYTGFAVLVRFNPSGRIDARDASAYAAATTVRYSAGQTYHFRLAVDVGAKTYSAFVRAPGGAEQTLGTGLRFRSEQSSASPLDWWGVFVHPTAAGTDTVCNFTLVVPPTPSPSPSPGGGVVPVSTAAQLTAALSAARPGQTIVLAAGTYAGRFTAAASGTAAQPITLRGAEAAVLDGGDTGGGYGLHVTGSFWTLAGFTVTRSQKGIVLDGASHCLLDGVVVHDVGMEAVHFRSFSSSNTIQNSRIFNTGLVDQGFGEGIYIGSAKSNWGTYSGGNPDACDGNRAIGNRLGPNIAAEHFDLKEGTTGGLISGNTMDGTGISGANFADSWIDVKGNGYTIGDNVGTNPGASALLDGIQTHVQLAGWGNNNTFRRNHLDVRAGGFGFNIQSGSTGNVVCSDNVVTGAAQGAANVPLASCP